MTGQQRGVVRPRICLLRDATLRCWRLAVAHEQGLLVLKLREGSGQRQNDLLLLHVQANGASEPVPLFSSKPQGQNGAKKVEIDEETLQR